MTRGILFAVLLVAASLGFLACREAATRPAETEIVLLYHSNTAGEIEECG